MHRAFQRFVLSAFALSFVSSALSCFGQKQQVSVFVFSDVEISPEMLGAAEKRATEIFSSARIAVAWINCVQRAGGTLDSSCDRSYVRGDVVLRITSHISTAISKSAFGIAWMGAGVDTGYADVFWPRVLGLANSNLNLACVLGSVMAHEAGHLLLGANSHSITGIMRAQWGSTELDRIAKGTLLFLPEQGKRMRAGLRSSDSLLISSQADRWHVR